MLAAVGLLQLSSCSPDSESSGITVNDLAAAISSRRPLRMRLSGLQQFDACPRGEGLYCHAAPEPGSTEYRRLGALNARLRRAAGARPTADNWHLLGISSLLLQTANETAVAQLQRALALDQRSMAIRNDLAVALATRGETSGSLLDQLRALETLLTPATDDDPALLFNRARLLERLGLELGAARAWASFARHPGANSWSSEQPAPTSPTSSDGQFETEVETALAGPDHKATALLVRAHPRSAAEYALRYSLPPGPPLRASEALRLLADLLVRDGDWLLRDVVSALETTEARTAIDRGLSDWLSALQRLAGGDRFHPGQALAHLQEAERTIGSGGRPLTLEIGLQIVRSHYFLGAFDTAASEGQALLTQIPSRRYPLLAARLSAVLGTVHMARRDPALARFFFTQAIDLSAAPTDHRRLARARIMRANASAALGDDNGAWRDRLEALDALPLAGFTIDRWQLMTDIAYGASSLGLPNAALAFIDDAVQLSDQAEDPLRRLVPRLHRAALLQTLAQRDAGAADLARARELSRQLPDEPTRSDVEARINRQEARLAGGVDPRRGLELLSEALETLFRHQQELKTELLREQATLEIALGKLEPAEASFLLALQIAEEGGNQLAMADDLLTYRDLHRQLYEDLIDLYLRRLGRPAPALAMAERAAGMLLRDWASPSSPTTPKAPTIARFEPPPHTVLLRFEVLADATVVWVLRSSAAAPDTMELETTRTALAASVAELRATVGRDPEALREQLGRLYNLLLRPLAPLVSGAEQLVIAPDESLWLVPFAALYDREADQFLVERHGVIVQPQLAATDRALRPAPSRAGRPRTERFLLVDAPATSSELFPGLPKLRRTPDATIRRLSESFATVEVLAGADARRSRVTERLRDSSVIQLNAHAFASTTSPLDSALALGPDGAGDSGLLYGRELLAVDLSRCRLVILAGCNTAYSRPGKSEGVSGLVLPFLAAGAEGVLASVWDLDDETATRLLSRFHHQMAAGLNPAAALRTAQIAEIQNDRQGSSKSPLAWAPLVMYQQQPRSAERGER